MRHPDAEPLLRMQLDDVAVGNQMVASDLLTVESGFAPHARVPECARNVLVHEPRDVLHRLAAFAGGAGADEMRKVITRIWRLRDAAEVRDFLR